MDSEQIDELLKKYWACETSLEEEQRLQAYFRKGPVTEPLKETAALFEYFAAGKDSGLTDITFEKELLKRMQTPARGRTTTFLFNSLRIAAGILVLLVAVWLVRMEVRKSSPAQVVDTYDDPRMAFEETKKALMMISKSFSTAEEQARKIQIFNEAQKDIRKENTKAL